jgi:hypothetical protein
MIAPHGFSSKPGSLASYINTKLSNAWMHRVELR